MIFSGYSYDIIGPHFILYNIDSGKYKKQYLNKESFTIKKIEERYCVGVYNLSKLSYSPCPKHCKLDITSKINNCKECYRKIGFNPAFYNAKKISPQQIEYNNTSHVVYLAYFSPKHIKIGIASKKRVSLRLLEQGARAAFILKTFPNAYLARNLEEKLCKENYELLEKLLSVQKLKILSDITYNSNLANELLVNIIKKINIIPESVFLDFNSKYFYQNYYNLNNLKIIKNSEFLSGETIGMIGDIVILKQKELLIALSIKNFISYKINIKYNSNFIEYSDVIKQLSLW